MAPRVSTRHESASLTRTGGSTTSRRSCAKLRNEDNLQRGLQAPEEQHIGDLAAFVLTAFHEVLRPVLQHRCTINSQTGNHLRSITNGKRFVSDNVKYCMQVFHNIVGNPAQVGDWFLLHHVRGVIHNMLLEANKAQRGRWQWRGFWLQDWESDLVVTAALRAYVAGCERSCNGLTDGTL